MSADSTEELPPNPQWQAAQAQLHSIMPYLTSDWLANPQYDPYLDMSGPQLGAPDSVLEGGVQSLVLTPGEMLTWYDTPQSSRGDRDRDFGHFFEEWTRCRSLVTPEWFKSEVLREDVKAGKCDGQGINWKQLKANRQETIAGQKQAYINHTARPLYRKSSKSIGSTLRSGPKRFQFRSFRKAEPYLSHFQLRHLISAPSKFEVFYVTYDGVQRYNAAHSGSELVIDGSKMEITCMSATDGLLIAGGHGGDFILQRLDEQTSTSGRVSQPLRAITNHVHTSYGRSSSYARAIFSSNDNKIRVLDPCTNQFIQEQSFTRSVNCAATSRDGRWRATVADEEAVRISDAETGEICHTLHSHRDHGFACAWSDDNVHLATASQDRHVCVWDARHLKLPITDIRSEVAPVRSLQFSPTGSGPRVLLMTEAAHSFSLVDATSFEHEQRFDCFGHLTGACFTPDGDSLVVANCDAFVGGITHYERRYPAKNRERSRDTVMEIQAGNGRFWGRGHEQGRRPRRKGDVIL